mmetsp:Transcript_2692/g.7884  ORF Transcript_2692/g.7884 Transcript_2692/m.7884 type:complete len:275 (+) Transcript_2692:1125-1949(+)
MRLFSPTKRSKSPPAKLCHLPPRNRRHHLRARDSFRDALASSPQAPPPRGGRQQRGSFGRRLPRNGRVRPRCGGERRGELEPAVQLRGGATRRSRRHSRANGRRRADERPLCKPGPPEERGPSAAHGERRRRRGRAASAVVVRRDAFEARGGRASRQKEETSTSLRHTQEAATAPRFRFQGPRRRFGAVVAGEEGPDCGETTPWQAKIGTFNSAVISNVRRSEKRARRGADAARLRTGGGRFGHLDRGRLSARFFFSVNCKTADVQSTDGKQRT